MNYTPDNQFRNGLLETWPRHCLTRARGDGDSPKSQINKLSEACAQRNIRGA